MIGLLSSRFSDIYLMDPAAREEISCMVSASAASGYLLVHPSESVSYNLSSLSALAIGREREGEGALSRVSLME